ncbi:hypothetical protein B0O99DRAFT_674588 [Bisporella sp. PMI_857]|nr:hypothetical protein B0O99DRAFT_674588 [Bisporella sp. PMI_857]
MLDRPEDGWKGVKFLGKGGYGIAGLWEYQGSGTNAPQAKHVVIKQTSDEEPPGPVRGNTTARTEGQILGLLSTTANTRHIVKQYGGNKLGDRWNSMEWVIRIFLEYCLGGDLERLVSFH